MKKLSVLIIISLLLTLFSACSDENTKADGSVNFGEYSPEVESTTIYYNNNELISSDISWLDAYALSYSYYDKDSGESIITEGKCGNYYQSHDSATNTITFYSQQESYVLQYLLNSDTKTGTATIITEGTIDDLYSGFSMISTCDPYFPAYSNVTKVGQDFVAERSATRYKQVQTENGVITKIAYVWIDDEYGFASRCEQYNAETEELEMRWELLDFTVNVTEKAVKINIDAYDIATEEN